MIYLLAFIFGASLGSFANVLADRLGVKDIMKDRSECLSCGKKLSFLELIPIVSYIWQRGKCKKCKSKIPVGLLLSELFAGTIVALLVTVAQGFSMDLALQAIYFFLLSAVVCVSVAIIIYDIRHMSVPIQLIIPLLLISFAVMMLGFYEGGFSLANLLSPIIVAMPFSLLYIFSHGKWVGLGDIILYFCFGMILALPAAISSFFYSVWLGAFVSVFLIIISKRDYNLKSEVPFTPFIILGALLALYFDPDILYIKDLMSIYAIL